MDKVDKFKITPSTTKCKTRLHEHGDIWELFKGPHVHNTGRCLLQSAKTGYVRWWDNNQLTPV